MSGTVKLQDKQPKTTERNLDDKISLIDEQDLLGVIPKLKTMLLRQLGLLPSGGTSGQVLKKTGEELNDVVWDDNEVGLPEGGTSGQILKKNSETDFDATWGDMEALPEGGTSGQVLTKKSETDFDVEWRDSSGGAEIKYQEIRNEGFPGVLNASPMILNDMDREGELQLHPGSTIAYIGNRNMVYINRTHNVGGGGERYSLFLINTASKKPGTLIFYDPMASDFPISNPEAIGTDGGRPIILYSRMEPDPVSGELVNRIYMKTADGSDTNDRGISIFDGETEQNAKNPKCVYIDTTNGFPHIVYHIIDGGKRLLYRKIIEGGTPTGIGTLIIPNEADDGSEYYTYIGKDKIIYKRLLDGKLYIKSALNAVDGWGTLFVDDTVDNPTYIGNNEIVFTKEIPEVGYAIYLKETTSDDTSLGTLIMKAPFPLSHIAYLGDGELVVVTGGGGASAGILYKTLINFK